MGNPDATFVFGGDLSDVKESLDDTKSYIQGWGNSIKAIGVAAFTTWATTAGIGAVINVIKGAKAEVASWIDAAAEAEQVDLKLGLAIRQAGKDFSYTAEQVSQMASDLQEVSVFGDEAIKMAQTSLIQYGLTGRAFRETAEAATQMASVLGTDVTQAAQTIGMAMLNPQRAARLLRVEFEALTDAQRAEFKEAVATGDTLKAQGIILDAVKAKYGDAASEIAGSWTGMKMQLAEIIGDIREELGGGFLDILKQIMPVIRTLAKHVKDLAGDFRDWFGSLASSGTAKVGIIAISDLLMKMFSFVETAIRRIPGEVKALFGQIKVELAALKVTLASINPFGAEKRSKEALKELADARRDLGQIERENNRRNFTEAGLVNDPITGVRRAANFFEESQSRFEKLKSLEAQQKAEREKREADLDYQDSLAESKAQAMRSANNRTFSRDGMGFAAEMAFGGISGGVQAGLQMGSFIEASAKSWEEAVLTLGENLEDVNKPFSSAIETASSVFTRIQTAAAGSGSVQEKSLTTQQEMLKSMRQDILNKREEKSILEQIRDNTAAPQFARAG